MDEIILYTQTDFEEELKRLTNGKGVQVVYDSVGKDTFDKSINCLSRCGMMVLFGAASGPVPDFNPSVLQKKGSLFLTRPTLPDHIADRATLESRTNDLFRWIKEGDLKLRIEHIFPLAEVQEAHRSLGGGDKGKASLLGGRFFPARPLRCDEPRHG